MTRYALYMRTQVAAADAILEQRERLLEHVKSHPEARIVVTLADLGSAMDPYRDGLLDLLGWVARGDVDVVLVTHLDRLARGTGLVLRVFEKLVRAGVRVEIAGTVGAAECDDATFDATSHVDLRPDHELLARVKAAFEAFERDLLGGRRHGDEEVTS